jgi:FlaA1/EpsC-like NDP-sugar epimerase
MDPNVELFIEQFLLCLIFGFMFSISFGRMVAQSFSTKNSTIAALAVSTSAIIILCICLFFNEWSLRNLSTRFYGALFAAMVVLYLLSRILNTKET